MFSDNGQQVRRLVDDSVNANWPDVLVSLVGSNARVHPGTPGAARTLKVSMSSE